MMVASLNPLLTFLIALRTVDVVFAKCDGGNDLGNKVTATEGLEVVCKTMQGGYKNDQTRVACVSKPNEDTYWHYEVWDGDKDGILNFNDCKEGLGREIRACANGGASYWGKWWFKVDVKNGACKDNWYINEHPNGKRSSEADEGGLEVYFGGSDHTHGDGKPEKRDQDSELEVHFGGSDHTHGDGKPEKRESTFRA